MTMPDIKVNHHRSTPITVDEQTAKLKSKLLKDIKRSAYVYRVDCGGCNGCEIEIFSAITPVFDAERFGIKVVPSPRHADILLFTGAVTRAMRVPALRAYESAPIQKSVSLTEPAAAAAGFSTILYCVWGGSESIVPIDVWIPGCPPTPAATIYGFAVALGLLEQKLKGENHLEQADEKAALLLPGIPLHTRVLIEREARRLAGYYQGRIISDRFLSLLAGASMDAATLRLEEWLQQESDPRLREIVACLVDCLQQELTHAK